MSGYGLVPKRTAKERRIKCVVWDLDHTLWDGVLLEDDRVTLRRGAVDIIRTLDARGILHSIASRNDYDAAFAELERFGLSEYFLYPKINWDAKSASIRAIAQSLNFDLDAIAFVDDQVFEREEVNSALPQVLTIDASALYRIPLMPEMNPRFVTDDSCLRRLVYQSDAARKLAEREFAGSSEEFLAGLNMVFRIQRAGRDDLQRAEELTVRTNQLNSTGYTYSYEELEAFLHSYRHLLLIASLEDRFGAYGKIGLALVECSPEAWTIRLLLVSCRVISRGVGTILLQYIMGLAAERRVRLLAEFISNGRNRAMYICYRFAGFREVREEGNTLLLQNDLSRIQLPPPYIRVLAEE